MTGTPERTAVYRIRGENDALLYIGVTNSVVVRWNGHQAVQPWWDELRSMTFEWYDTRAEAEAAEKAAILAEQPKYNVTYLSPLRGKRKQAQETQSEPIEVPPLPDVALEPRDDDQDLLDLYDVAKVTRLGVPQSVLRALEETGGPAGFKLGHTRLFRRSEIRRWIAAVELSQQPAPAPVGTEVAVESPEPRPRPRRSSGAPRSEAPLFAVEDIA